MRTRTTFHALAFGVLVLAACSDQNEPVAPSDPTEPSPGTSTAQGDSHDPISLGRAVRGFGGFYLDSQGTPVVYLKDAGERANAERALAPFLRSQGLTASQLRVVPGKYEWGQLESWFAQSSREVLAAPGGVFVDADEAANRVTIGVERGSIARIRAIVVRLRIPEEAVVILETEPVRFAATLRDRIRPVVGGLQINFPGFLCTLGFNATRSGQSSFITNSHCTNDQGGTEGTPYWQPLESVDPVQIGTEVDDPVYVRGPDENGCPRGFRCRFSDASRAAYASGISFELGIIARTTGPNNNSFTIDPEQPSFRIRREGTASVGQTANKVGRTTGWTQGPVTRTCVNTGVLGSNIVQLCQTFVNAGVAGGDSGSPVFLQSPSGQVTLVGILWGGSGPSFVYSPISNIERELGSLTTF